jgi:hypothetical protein
VQVNKRNSPAFYVSKAKWGDFVKSYDGPYDFSESIYAGMNHDVYFKCPNHGEMKMAAKYAMQGKQCVKCSYEARRGRNRFDTASAVARFTYVHGSTYDYSKVTYNGQQKHVTIICKKHGEFQQKPEFHWTGSGCPQCFHEDRRGSSQRDTLETFTEKTRNIFGDLFELSDVVYKNSQSDIDVLCTKHQSVCKTKPNWLLNGCNPCPQCNHMKSSGEDTVFSLMSTYTEAEQRNRTILKPKELGIYLPKHKLAIEYCGMFWHSYGSEDEARSKKNDHYNKYKACKDQGIRLITLYESEWLEHNYAVRRLLRNAVGKSKGKLMARKCELRRVSNAEARGFYDRYHPQGGAGNGEHYALFWKGKMVACMRFVLGPTTVGQELLIGFGRLGGTLPALPLPAPPLACSRRS